jgi:lipid A 3-O-deacylase
VLNESAGTAQSRRFLFYPLGLPDFRGFDGNPSFAWVYLLAVARPTCYLAGLTAAVSGSQQGGWAALIRMNFSALAAALAMLALGASAGLAPAAAQPRIFDEIKVGVLDHDIGIFGHHKESGGDVNLELLFASPDFLRVIGAPRPHIGTDVNSDGNTSQFYLGLTWHLTLVSGLMAKSDPLYIEASLGGAVHNGEADGPSSDTEKRLGSQLLFRESLELGWRFTDSQSIGIYMDHISNAGIAKHNEGLTNLGARLGFKF